MRKRINIVISLLLTFLMFGCSSNNESKDNEPIETKIADTEEATEEQEELPILFDGDSNVNEVLVSYNDVNKDNQIEYGDFEIYHHHGSDHTDQAKCFNYNGFEIVVTGSSSYIDVYIGYTKDNKTNEEYKEEALKWIKALYPSASDFDIESAWQEAEDTSTFDATIKNEVFTRMNISVTSSNGKIEYLKIYKYNS